MDYYQVLGVAKNASQDDIKKAFHKLAHQYHPDKGGDERKFKEINEAYQVLSNKEKRAQYDQFGRVFDGQFSAQGGPSSGWDWNWMWGNRPQGGEDGFEYGDIGDIFEDFLGFGGGGRRAKAKDHKKGKDIQVDIEVDLKDTLEQTAKKIGLGKMILCQRCSGAGAEPGSKVKECFSCRGTGQVQQIKKILFGSYTTFSVCPECQGEGTIPEKPCNVCKGQGRIKGQEEFEIFIPAGVDTNQIIKMEGRGDAGKKGGKPGNLYVRILVKEHTLFSRKGDDLFAIVDITFSQAALGDEVEIETLEGKKLSLEVPPGTESGKILRISGKGVPHFGGYGRGNLYVELNIKTPKKLSKKQKDLIEKLQEEGI